MKEYIEREAARRAIEHADPAFCYCIDYVPAADVAPVVHGQVMLIADPVLIKCDAVCPYCATAMKSDDHYCPNCGAKMDMDEV